MDKLRVVIVEDEPATARNLGHILKVLNEDIVILKILPAVAEAVEWFNRHQDGHDLIFMDIRLADGVSFDIFKTTNINSPVIFVTAYDNYAIQAFKNNGIDYILKPFDEEEIAKALHKYMQLTSSAEKVTSLLSAELIQQLHGLQNTYKRSFLIHHRNKLIPIEAARIAWLYTAHELVYAQTFDDRQYTMEFTMEQLEQQLDPYLFFRANRQFIANRQAITEVDFYFNGRLSLKLKPLPEELVLISKARVPIFKAWMQG